MYGIYGLLATLLAVTQLGISAAAHPRIDLQRSDYVNFPDSLGQADFFSKVSDNIYLNDDPVENCRDGIAAKMCLVEPIKPAKGFEDPEERPCLAGGHDYAFYFERIYDDFPPALQKMFCSLNTIFIEKEFIGTAYAGTLKDSKGQSRGAIMGIRKSVLDENLDLATWASWKEQLSFGGEKGGYRATPGLPTIETSGRPTSSDFLYFVVAHEFGHIFDLANGLNQTSICSTPPPPEEPECSLAAGTWGALSWLTTLTPKPRIDFPLRSRLCFYWCSEGEGLSPRKALQLYAGLAQSNFISTYATRQPYDDFADSLAYFLMQRQLGQSYLINTKQGKVYDVMAKLSSPLFGEKYAFIEAFLGRSDIIYP